jgi:acetyl esterase
MSIQNASSPAYIPATAGGSRKTPARGARSGMSRTGGSFAAKGLKPLLAGLALAASTTFAVAATPAAPATPDKATSQFLQVLNSGKGPAINTLTPVQARQVLVDAQNGVKVDLSGIDVSTRTIEQDGISVPLTIVRPQGATGTLPVFMFFHGGGWILGDFQTHERLVHDIVVQSGAVAVFVNYTPSPEARYPVAINQAYAATKWVAAHGDEIGVDGSRLAVVGNSVGGNMAAAVSLMAKNKQGPAIRFQGLMWPVTDNNFNDSSYAAYPAHYFLTRPMMMWFWDAYTKDSSRRDEIYASPLRASTEQLKGLPPALIQVAQFDVLRDEGEAYGRKLDAAGNDVTTTRYNGTIHDFGLLNALADDSPTKAAIKQLADQLRTRLQ